KASGLYLCRRRPPPIANQTAIRREPSLGGFEDQCMPPDLDPASISAAFARIKDRIRETPVVEIDGADFGVAATRFVFKLEQLQHSGSFKARGAFANLLLRDIPPAGVTAASGGNHGAAVAFAARALGVKAKIFVPTVSSPAKVER